MKGIYQLFKRDGYDMLSSRKNCQNMELVRIKAIDLIKD